MDSITQVILGATCGEAVLGKKIGNRAMIWGGIAGTIPDLDVIANLVADPLTALAFHRGPMHSLLFACIMPFLLGPLIKKLYDRNWPELHAWKITGYSIGLLLYVFVSVLITLLANLLKGGIAWSSIFFFSSLGILFFYFRYQQVFKKSNEVDQATKWEWIHLFFWAIFTHPILDMFTTFGTRLFWPFSDVRVAISSVSIADPFYTIPFAVFLLLAALQNRLSIWRKYFYRTAVIVSSLYFIFTLYNKQKIDTLFENSLKMNQIECEKYMTVPTILNNFLWFNIAKKGDQYYYAYYSIFDQADTIGPLATVNGNHALFNPYRDQDVAKCLPWFSNDFYKLSAKDSGTLIYYDLRYGATGNNLNSDDDIVFKFILKDSSGKLMMDKSQPQPENNRDQIDKFKRRIVGIKD